MKTIQSIFTAIFLIFTFYDVIYSQKIYINEVQSVNQNTIRDEDDESSDWFEIYNPNNFSVNLNNYSVSDDKQELRKWVFPDVVLKPNSYLLVFASDKNRTIGTIGWQTIINKGDTWKFKIFTSEPPVEWKNIGYNDLAWQSGPSGFGFGDGDDSTIVQATISLYLRKTFTIDDTASIKDALLHIDYDDGFVAYLNGVELTRKNLGNAGQLVPYNKTTDDYSEAQMYQGGKPYEFRLEELHNLLKQGENVLAIQVHNQSLNSSDLTLIPFFTIGLNYSVDNSFNIGLLTGTTLPKLHTNFKISSEGEKLFLVDNNSNLVDSIIVPALTADVSYGRSSADINQLLFFSVPTPEKENLSYGFNGFTANPTLNIEGGLYSSSVSINVTNNSEIEKVYYTTDGSLPDSTDLIYSSPINISNTKVLRFIGYSSGKLKSDVVTNTYIINQATTMPIISISTNPENLWDNEIGIYVLGDDYNSDFPYMGANFWQDWERPAHFEIYEPDGITKYKSNAGLKIHGNWSRAFAQKSVALFARGEYGNKEFEYKLFPNRNFSKYNNFILRNSGQDWESTMMRDLMMQNLVEGIDLDLQAGRPCVVYLNGSYWGIHNIREKLNEDMLASHHNLNPDEINILENNGDIVEGTNERYLDLMTFVNNNSLITDNNYQFVKNNIQVDNYIDYMLSQIYFANVDWPGNNIKYWTTQSDTSRWRWLIFDTDHGFGLYNANAASHNTLTFALATNGPNWPNPPWSTLLFRKLVQNQSFKFDLLNRFADLANSILKKEKVLAKIDSLRNIYEPEINKHITKWGAFTYSGWLNNINFIRGFANSRISYLTLFFLQQFGVQTTSVVHIGVNDKEKGNVKINRLKINDYPFNGFYFKGIPVQVTAIPKKGYKFVKWSGIATSDSPVITIIPNQLDSLFAIFTEDDSSGTIVINEINYNSNSNFNTEDWIELFNTSSRPADISGWRFKDEDNNHNFIFPENTIISGKGYLVVCIDTALFKSKFPNVINIIGNTGFGLSGSGELIRIYDKNLSIVDSLTYDDSSPWPTAPDGQGASLSLINPYLDNSIPQSWKASIQHGTPGTINDVFTNMEDELSYSYNYKLEQNYPNPFNPVTTINFTLAENSDIELSVYNILGQKVENLFNGILDKGSHSILFNASNFSSGVYFYTLNIKDKNKVFTKKMVLLK